MDEIVLYVARAPEWIAAVKGAVITLSGDDSAFSVSGDADDTNGITAEGESLVVDAK